MSFFQWLGRCLCECRIYIRKDDMVSKLVTHTISNGCKKNYVISKPDKKQKWLTKKRETTRYSSKPHGIIYHNQNLYYFWLNKSWFIAQIIYVGLIMVRQNPKLNISCLQWQWLNKTPTHKHSSDSQKYLIEIRSNLVPAKKIKMPD